MRVVTLEEHFVTESFVRATEAAGHETPPSIRQMHAKLLDVGAGRIAAMDEGGITTQVLSLASMGMERLDAAEATAVVREVNDELATAVEAYPERLAGFATLGLKDPEGAAAELERCVTKLGFAGALVDGTTESLFLDDARFLPLWETAAKLGVPVYLHPSLPPPAVREVYYAGLPAELGNLLSIAGWGWHAETALHTLRLIVSGLFDRLPELQLIIGHMGEMLPMALTRSSAVLSGAASLRRPVAEYFQSNIHLTTSGYFTVPPLRCALDVVGLERMMFSVDYPFSANTRGKAYLEELAKMLSPGDLEKLAHGNADRLLRLAA